MPCSFPSVRGQEDEVLNNGRGNPGVHASNGTAGRARCQGRQFPGSLIRMNRQPFFRLRSCLTVTFVLAVFVVFAGATVRATGSGMGCPDWPLCYGCWIPPVSVDQLPADYAQKYAVAGHPAEFDAVKTWIEYINRLLGAATGMAMVVTVGFSIPVVRSKPSLGMLAMVSCVVLGFIAWLGAKVVDSYLASHAVTFHLVAAYTLLVLLLGQREIVDRALEGPRPTTGKPLTIVVAVVGAAFAVQWVLGIRIREEVEAWIWGHDLSGSLWEGWGGAYDLHKISAVMVGLVAALLAWMGWRGRARDSRVFRLTFVCAGFVVLQAGVGLVLWWGQQPPWAKPLHLLFATGAWAAWVALVLHSLPTGASKNV